MAEPAWPAADRGASHSGALDSTVAAYRRDPADPQVVTRLFQQIWRERGERAGAVYTVPPCPYARADLAGLAARQRRPAYLPAELATQGRRHLLGRMFPLLRSHALFEHNAVTNLDNPAGWFDYDAAEDAPYGGTDEATLIAQVRAEGRWLASLNQYVVAAQDGKLLTGRYLDQGGTWSRFAHYVDQTMVCTRIDGPEPPTGPRAEVPNDGCLLVAFDLGAGDRSPALGGRSVGAPPAGRPVVDDEADPASLSPEAIADLPDITALNLDREWARQAGNFVRLGFPAELGLDADDYRASLPRFALQPHRYRGRLDIPLLVETRIGWERQADLADISRSIGSRTTTFTPIDERHAVPAGPYAAWVNWFGQRFPQPIAPEDARDQLAADERGGNVHELVALHMAHPVLNSTGRFIDAIGFESRTMNLLDTADDGARRNPGLCNWRARAEIGANLHPVAYPMFRPLVRGTSITT